MFPKTQQDKCYSVSNFFISYERTFYHRNAKCYTFKGQAWEAEPENGLSCVFHAIVNIFLSACFSMTKHRQCSTKVRAEDRSNMASVCFPVTGSH